MLNKFAVIPFAIVFSITGAFASGGAFAQESGDVSGPIAGRTDFNTADRLAIINLIDAYAINFDNQNLDEWFELFTPDAKFIVRAPGWEPKDQTMGEEFKEFWRQRVEQFKRDGHQRRRVISNVVFLEEGVDTAHTIMAAILTNTTGGKTFTVVTSISYEGRFVKSDGVWKIQEWHDILDVNPNP